MTERNRLLKTYKIASLVGLFMFIAGIVLAAIGAENDALVTIGVILIILGFATFVAGRVLASQVKKCFCKECGKRYDYDNDISWEVISEETTSNSNGARKTAKVEITCSCSNCGNEKTFNKNVCIATVDRNGKVTHTNLDAELKKYFKNC